MKKQSVIAAIGTLALVANLIVPGLTFADDQTGTQQIGCGNLTLQIRGGNESPSFGNFSMTPLTASTSAQNSYGYQFSDFSNTAYQNGTDQLPGNADAEVTDLRTEGSGTTGPCSTNDGDEGFNLTVSATDFSDGTHSIPASGFYIGTTTNVDTSSLMIKAKTAVGTDGTWDRFLISDDTITNYITAPYDIAETESLSTDVTTPAVFTGLGGALNAAKTIIDNSSGLGTDNGFIGSAGVGVAYYLSVPPSQAAGTYSSTVTYTLASAT